MNFNHMKSQFINSLLKNAIYLIFTNLIISASGFVFWILAARYYSSTDVGLGSATISAMILISMISMLGFNVSLIRFLPNSNEKKNMINSCLTLSLFVSSIVSICFLFGLKLWMPKLLFLQNNIYFAVFFIILTCVSTISAQMNSILISLRKSKYTLFKISVFGIFRLSILIFLVPLEAFGIYLSWGVGIIIAFIVGIWLVLKIIPDYTTEIFIKFDIIKNMFKFSFMNYIANFLSMSIGLILPLMITIILSPEINAYFWISWNIAGLLFAVSISISQSLFAEGSNSNAKIIGDVKRSFIYIFLILIPSLLFILLFGDQILLLFGNEYLEEGSYIVKILAISSLPFAINTVYITIKNISKQVIIVVIINGIIMIITLVGSYISLINNFGLNGIGISWLTGNLITIPLIMIIEYKHSIFK
ncbi:MAG: lipopolysaccharide biosynthesis protein [Methanosarcinales archaeon]|nr:lipopolysaccharide biosynthesis protein [Methanosarcinales archaeon]